MSTFVLNVLFEPKFWRRYCSTKLERNSYMNFLCSPLESISWRRPCIQYIQVLYIYQLSLVPPPPHFYTWRTQWYTARSKFNFKIHMYSYSYCLFIVILHSFKFLQIKFSLSKVDLNN